LNQGGSGQLEGLPIAGVRTLCEDKPFRVYNGLTNYNEWLFTYLDLELRAMPGQGNNRGKQLNPGSGLQQQGGGFGNQQGQPGFGNQQGQPGLGNQQGQPGFGGQPGQQRPGTPRR
jgi:hypothetical protein